MRLRLPFLVALSAWALAWGGAALAQTSDAPPPVHSSVDANGVDLTSGTLRVADTYVTIGDPKQGGLAWIYFGGLVRDNFYGAINHTGSTYTVSLGGSSLVFSLSGTTFTSLRGDGSTLTQSGGTYTLTLRDGTVATFSSAWASSMPTQGADGRVTSIVEPLGLTTNFFYKKYSFIVQLQGDRELTIQATRLQGVTNNIGYELKYTYYANDNSQTAGQIQKVTGINTAVEYCDPLADACTLTNAWPVASVSGSSITDAMNRTTTYPYPAPSSTKTLSRPGGPNWTIQFDGSTRVASISNGTGTWTYGYVVSGSTLTTTMTDPLSHTRKVAVNTTTGLVSSDTNGTSNATSYLYDGYGRVTQVTLPEGGYTIYTYDTRGNVKLTQSTPKAGSSLAVRTTTADYDPTCTYAKKCNSRTGSRMPSGTRPTIHTIIRPAFCYTRRRRRARTPSSLTRPTTTRSYQHTTTRTAPET